MSTLYVKVDDNRCCGYSSCHELCPEVFLLDKDGFAYVEQSAVPDALRDRAEEAAKNCPEGAIAVGPNPL